MITAEIYRSGLLRKSWKFRLIGANNRKFGHDYNSIDSAREALTTLLASDVPVRLRVVGADGSVTNHGNIR